jgi:hypothetical protein
MAAAPSESVPSLRAAHCRSGYEASGAVRASYRVSEKTALARPNGASLTTSAGRSGVVRSVRAATSSAISFEWSMSRRSIEERCSLRRSRATMPVMSVSAAAAAASDAMNTFVRKRVLTVVVRGMCAERGEARLLRQLFHELVTELFHGLRRGCEVGKAPFHDDAGRASVTNWTIRSSSSCSLTTGICGARHEGDCAEAETPRDVGWNQV